MERRTLLTATVLLFAGCARRTRSGQSGTTTALTSTPTRTPTTTTTNTPAAADTATETETRTETATPAPSPAERSIQTALESLREAKTAYVGRESGRETVLDVTAASTSFATTEVRSRVDDARITLSEVDASDAPDDVRRRIRRLSEAATILRRIVNAQAAVVSAFEVHLGLRRAFYAGDTFKLHHKRDRLRSEAESISSSLEKLSNENLDTLDELTFWPPKTLRDKISQLTSERDAFEFFVGWYATAADGFDALDEAIGGFEKGSYEDAHTGCYEAESAFGDARSSLRDRSFPAGIDGTTDGMECVLDAYLEAIPELNEASRAALMGSDEVVGAAVRRAGDAFESCTTVEEYYDPI